MNRKLTQLCCAVILSAAAHQAAAVVVTQDSDALNLAAALAPSPGPGTSVTGDFTEFSAGAMLGTFTGGNATIGTEAGIVLSSGNASQITFGAPALSTGFGGSPTTPTATLLDLIPTISGNYSDTARFSLTVDPGLLNNYVNFSFGFLSNEISESDKFGIFIDDAYFGYVAGSPISLSHPWVFASLSNIGLASAMYEDGNGINPETFTLSLAVPHPGAAFKLDFVLADVFDDGTDTAVFLGGLTLSETALGTVAIPEPNTIGLLIIASLGLIARLRHRKQG